MGGINLYTYVKNNPLAAYDISGLKPLECYSCPGGHWGSVVLPGFSFVPVYGLSYGIIMFTCKTNQTTCAGEYRCKILGPMLAIGAGMGGGEVFNAYTAAALAGKSRGVTFAALLWRFPISVQLTFGESIANNIEIAKSIGGGVAYITCDVKITGCL